MSSPSMGHLLVRADANGSIGTGHVMRCMALAQAFLDTGGEATFVTAGLPPALTKRLHAEGMNVITIAAASGSAADASETTRLARAREASWIVVDGYQFDSHYQRNIKNAGPRLLWIDDQGMTAPYCADIILNQNLHAQASMYEDREASTRLLLGPRYALLRREFRRGREWRKNPVARAHKVLVTMGGADPDNVTLDVIAALQQMTPANLEAVVVVGPNHPNPMSLEEAIRSSSWIRLAYNVTNMPEWMAWADVAVSSGGSTCWELAFFGLPSVVVALADNQEAVVERLSAAGVALHASRDIVGPRLASLLTDAEALSSMARRGRELVDGDGAPRVVAQLRTGTLRLRRVRDEDCRLLCDWANDPMVREASFSPHQIPWEEHEAWFRARVNDPACLMYLAHDGENAVGQIRYDLEGQGATVSLSTSPEFRGRGYGSRMIRCGSQELFASTHAAWIDALIQPGNTASIAAFLKAGFVRNGTTIMRGLPAERLTLRRNEVRDERHD